MRAWPWRRDRAIRQLLDNSAQWQAFGQVDPPPAELAVQLRGRGLVMWRESALFRAAEAATAPKRADDTDGGPEACRCYPAHDPECPEHGEALDTSIACSPYQGNDEELDAQHARLTQERPENADARTRSLAALAGEAPKLRRRDPRFDPRPGIDDVGAFSGAGWEE